jgi:hypothetical protein
MLFFELDLYTEYCTLVRIEKGVMVDKALKTKDL